MHLVNLPGIELPGLFSPPFGQTDAGCADNGFACFPLGH